jgi:hypothetical protein
MMDWLSQNWTAIATVLNIAFAIVTIWLTIALMKKRKLLYHEYDVRTTVFQTEEAGSELTALYEGQQIEDDVTGVQIAIWNDGDKPIRSEHVLQDAKIVADDDAHILEPRLVERSRDVTGFEISSTSDQEVAFSWDILEKGDGGVVQVLYSGNPYSEFKVEGVVEEQGEVYNSHSEGLVNKENALYLSSLFIAFTFLSFVLLIPDYYYKMASKIAPSYIISPLIITFFILLLIPIPFYILPKITPSKPPFSN